MSKRFDMDEATIYAPKGNDSDEADILAELLERTKYCLQKWGDIRAEGDLNMAALSIEGPWPPEELEDRKKRKVPHGHTDIVSQYNNRVVNQWRMNPRGVKVEPIELDVMMG